MKIREISAKSFSPFAYFAWFAVNGQRSVVRGPWSQEIEVCNV